MHFSLDVFSFLKFEALINWHRLSDKYLFCLQQQYTSFLSGMFKVTQADVKESALQSGCFLVKRVCKIIQCSAKETVTFQSFPYLCFHFFLHFLFFLCSTRCVKMPVSLT